MQITCTKNQQIDIKTKDCTVTLAEGVKVKDFAINGPGEYEISGVEVSSQVAGVYRLRVEEVVIVYTMPAVDQLSEEDQKELNDVSILVLGLDQAKLDLKKVSSMIKSLEPTVIIPAGLTDTKEFCDAVGGCQDPAPNFKITKQQLSVMEGQTVVLLNSEK